MIVIIVVAALLIFYQLIYSYRPIIVLTIPGILDHRVIFPWTGVSISMCLSYPQGAIVGGTMSTLFSLWMVVGNFLFDPHQQSLPTSIDMCSNLTVSDDVRTNGSYSDSRFTDWDLTKHTSFYDVTTATTPVE